MKQYELEKKRIEFVEWQYSENFVIDDIDFKTVEKFIETCGITMVPALVSSSIKAAIRVGCFRSRLAAIRFVATVMEEEDERNKKK